MPRLENWSFTSTNNNLFQAPELRERYLNGEVYDDEYGRFKDGTRISTSYLVEVNLKEEFAKTRNTVYILGRPSEEYVNWLESTGSELLEDIMKLTKQ